MSLREETGGNLSSREEQGNREAGGNIRLSRGSFPVSRGQNTLPKEGVVAGLPAINKDDENLAPQRVCLLEKLPQKYLRTTRKCRAPGSFPDLLNLKVYFDNLSRRSVHKKAWEGLG